MFATPSKSFTMQHTTRNVGHAVSVASPRTPRRHNRAYCFICLATATAISSAMRWSAHVGFSFSALAAMRSARRARDAAAMSFPNMIPWYSLSPILCNPLTVTNTRMLPKPSFLPLARGQLQVAPAPTLAHLILAQAANIPASTVLDLRPFGLVIALVAFTPQGS